MFFYESIAQEWDSKMNKDELDKRLRLVFGQFLNEREVRSRRVLDAGAGTGHFSRVLSQCGAQLTAMDLGPTPSSAVRLSTGWTASSRFILL